MKNQIIHITSHKNLTKVSIRKGGRKLLTRRFHSIEKAISHVLPPGNRQTDLHLNGYQMVLAGWVI